MSLHADQKTDSRREDQAQSFAPWQGDQRLTSAFFFSA